MAPNEGSIWMSVSEYERHQLFTWFEEHMGPERAATMMNLVPPVGWGDVATKQNLQRLEINLEERLDTRLERLRSDLLRTFGTWLFASQAAVIAALSLLIALK